MKWHFCAVWRQEEKSKILVGRIRVKVLIMVAKKIFFLIFDLKYMSYLVYI